MIESFACKKTEKLFYGEFVKEFRLFDSVAKRKLDMLDSAQNLNDLRVPPANRLEMLKGNWKGYFSIRINDQFRICFQWINGNALNVEIVDYH